MGIITESAKQKIADKQPGDLVELTVHLTELCLLPDDCDVLLEQLDASIGIQTAYVAAVTLPVANVEALATLPSVKEVR